MKKLTALTVFAAALSFAGLTMAQDLTRAEVTAQLQAARDSGELARLQAEVGTSGLGNNAAAAKTVTASKPVPATAKTLAAVAAAEAAPAQAGRTRAEVVAELKAARDSGTLDQERINAELGFFPIAVRAPAATLMAGQPKNAQ